MRSGRVVHAAASDATVARLTVAAVQVVAVAVAVHAGSTRGKRRPSWRQADVVAIAAVGRHGSIGASDC
jgi:hypothetical protein